MPARVAPEQYDLLQEIVKKEADLTVHDVAWEFHRRTGLSVSRASMGRTLRKLRLTRTRGA
jgi:transposase